MRFLLILTLLCLIFTSCSIEKRTVKRGYYISWHHKIPVQSGKNNQAEKENSASPEILQTENEAEQPLLNTGIGSEIQDEHELDGENELAIKKPLQHQKEVKPDRNKQRRCLNAVKKVNPLGGNHSKNDMKSGKATSLSFLDNIVLFYFIVALGLILIGALFFLFASHSTGALLIILYVLSVISFLIAVYLIVAALFMLLFEKNFKNR